MINFEHISHFFGVRNTTMFLLAFDSEHVFVCWVQKKERRVIFGENKAATHKSYGKLRSLKTLECSLENTCDIGLLIILLTQRVQIYENEGSNKEIFHKWYFSELRVQQLAYVVYISTPTFIGVRMILDMRTLIRTLIFPYDFFKFFKICLVLIILYCLKTYWYKFDLYFFVLGRDGFFTVFICFKETLFFNFSYKLLNKYFSLLQSTSEFGVSVGK